METLILPTGEQHPDCQPCCQRPASVYSGESCHPNGDHVQEVARSQGPVGLPAVRNDPRLRYLHLHSHHHWHCHRQVR